MIARVNDLSRLLAEFLSSQNQNGSVIYRDKDYPINVSGQTCYDALINLDKLNDICDTSYKYALQTQDTFANTTFPAIEIVSNQSNYSLYLQEKNQRELENQKTQATITTIAFMLLGIATIIILIFFFKRQSQLRKHREQY